MKLDDPIIVIVLLILLPFALRSALLFWARPRITLLGEGRQWMWVDIVLTSAAIVLLAAIIDDRIYELRVLALVWGFAYLSWMLRIMRLISQDYAYPLPAEIRQVDVDEWNRFIHEKTGPRISGKPGTDKGQAQAAEKPSVLLEAMKGLEDIKEEQRDAVIIMIRAMMAAEFRKQQKDAVRLEIWSNTIFGALFLVLGVVLSDPIKELYQHLVSAIS